MNGTDVNSRVAHRLKIARGHMDKVIEMVEKKEYCIDILTQSKAVQAALKEADAMILENHLNTCVADAVKNEKKEDAIAEVMKVFRNSHN
jgi:CsoR family transcriptional regulator, copper-sensing transcriptional repressor